MSFLELLLVVTNYHELGILKQTTKKINSLTILQARSLKLIVLCRNQDVSGASGDSKEKAVPFPLQFLMAASIPCLMATFLQSLPPGSHFLLFCL